jgi:oxygen-independent coproporphyrinogen III oxidase
VSAISRIGNCYGQNLRDLRAWESAIDARRTALWRGLALSADDRVRANVIEQLMCHGRIDVHATEQALGIKFSAYFADSLRLLEPLVADGLVTRSAQQIAATDLGRLLLRSVAMCFDHYLGRPGIPPVNASRIV